jgi:ATP-dependent DNA helicase RecG
MNFKEIHKKGEGQHLEFKTSFGRETAETVAAFSNASGGTILMKGNYIAMHRNKLLAEAFYLRGDIEKFGTGFFRIQSELKNSPEVSFKLESSNGFTRSGLEVVSQDTPQDTPQDKILEVPPVKSLLEILNGEMTRKEIQTELKLQDRNYLRKSYLEPALSKGLIEMTLPDKPNSKYQKYRLTEKGKQRKQNLKKMKQQLKT